MSQPLPPGQFYSKRWVIYSALGEPSVDLSSWRLRLSGIVNEPYELDYSELVSLCDTKYRRDFHCVTKWSIRDVVWEGVSLRKLITKAQPKPEAKWVMFVCLDGYTSPVPLEDALSDESIVALKMNGVPLTHEQGFPARPFIPHLYGWKSAKWLCEVRVMEKYRDGYWEAYGYHERGNVHGEERFKGYDWRKIKKVVKGVVEANSD